MQVALHAGKLKIQQNESIRYGGGECSLAIARTTIVHFHYIGSGSTVQCWCSESLAHISYSPLSRDGLLV